MDADLIRRLRRLRRWTSDIPQSRIALVLDVMPPDEKILGFSYRWYKPTMENAENSTLEKDLIIRVATALY